MAIQFSSDYPPGFTLYGLILDPLSRAWNGTAFVDPTGVRPTCDIPMPYDSGSGTYIGTVPSSIPVGPTGTYTVRAYLQLGGTQDDDDPQVGQGTVTIPSTVVPRVSSDPDFLAELIHTAAVEFDTNSVGGFAGAHAGKPANWQPVAGLEEVACRVCLERAVPIENGSVRMGTVLFGGDVMADQRYSLRFATAVFGMLRLYLTGPVVDVDEMGIVWSADFQDRPLA
jgi:hypothetical protein